MVEKINRDEWMKKINDRFPDLNPKLDTESSLQTRLANSKHLSALFIKLYALSKNNEPTALNALIKRLSDTSEQYTYRKLSELADFNVIVKHKKPGRKSIIITINEDAFTNNLLKIALSTIDGGSE